MKNISIFSKVNIYVKLICIFYSFLLKDKIYVLNYIIFMLFVHSLF